MRLSVLLWALNLNLALAQAPPPLRPDPNQRPLGDLPAPSADEPASVPTTRGFGGLGGGYGLAAAGNYPLNNGAYAYYPASAGAAVIIRFSQTDTRNVDTLQEDLNVMALLLQKKIESAFGEGSPTYRMGIPLLLHAGQRSVESLFLDDFGAVFTVSVNFPLVPPPAGKAKESERTTGSDDWDKARKELYGVPETEDAGNPYGPGALPYDADQVGALKRALLESLKNAANIRGLKSDEWVVVTVFGTEGIDPGPAGGRSARRGSGFNTARPAAGTSWSVSSVGSRTGRGTVLTIRVRKSDAESFAKGTLKLEQFEQKATTAAYLGPATYGSSALWRSGYVPGQYPVSPMTR